MVAGVVDAVLDCACRVAVLLMVVYNSGPLRVYYGLLIKIAHAQFCAQCYCL